MRTRVLATASIALALSGIALVVVAQVRLAAIASIYTLQPGEEIITQVAYPLGPWPAVSTLGTAAAVVGTLRLIVLVVLRSRSRSRS